MSGLDVMSDGAASDSRVLSRALRVYRNRKKTIDYDALTQFVEGLRSDLELARNGLDASEVDAIEIASKISVKLDETTRHDVALDGKWNLAYHAEKLIISLLGPERQRIELDRRMSECDRIKAPFTLFYKEQIDKFDKDSDSRDQCFHLLVSVVRDMQAYNSNRHIKMRYARHAIYRVGLVFSFALILFLSIISLFHWV